MEPIEERIKTIEARNTRVETDKAWETSWTRRLSIAIATYIIADHKILVEQDILGLVMTSC
ncbi:MAG: hypothetical protein AAB420_01035 [Patescibacteria group bacterium]